MFLCTRTFSILIAEDYPKNWRTADWEKAEKRQNSESRTSQHRFFASGMSLFQVYATWSWRRIQFTFELLKKDLISSAPGDSTWDIFLRISRTSSAVRERVQNSTFVCLMYNDFCNHLQWSHSYLSFHLVFMLRHRRATSLLPTQLPAHCFHGTMGNKRRKKPAKKLSSTIIIIIFYIECRAHSKKRTKIIPSSTSSM